MKNSKNTHNILDWIILPDLIKYKDALDLMHERLQDIIDGKKNNTVFLLEHESVYTTGTSYNESEILRKNHIPIINTGRGGKATYHGPGQRVIYPILNLAQYYMKDIKLYIHNLELWIINSLARVNVTGYKLPNLVGIWVKYRGVDSKIAAIGIRVRKWITYHGIAINISTDLDHYSNIIPCGIKNTSITSLQKLGINISMKELDVILKDEFNKIF